MPRACHSVSTTLPVVALKEGAQPGERWHVSTEEVAGLRGDTWGEVIGGFFVGLLVAIIAYR